MHYPHGPDYLASRRGQDPKLLDVHARLRSQEPELPVPLEDIQEDLRVDSDDDLATIGRIADGVCAYLEERTAWAFKVGEYESRLSEWWPGQSVKNSEGAISGRHHHQLPVSGRHLDRFDASGLSRHRGWPDLLHQTV